MEYGKQMFFMPVCMGLGPLQESLTSSQQESLTSSQHFHPIIIFKSLFELGESTRCELAKHLKKSL